ncbi:Flagellar protein FliT [Lentibacillus sp. JNUCC-1]|uniref:flagellar protein FliT n=1 Tax=Lentibacillus sp. JNUCC-1 TaxID=2654513 RepID=UPI0012E7E26C|nr:flagellar protein FliT [Lentibacillus sp. JNUCC-1]MUV39064.1 Flagellar protein FliT [Lentibacillus sp. JNUCC-1]
MHKLEDLLDVTERLAGLFGSSDTKQSREQLIDEMNQLVEERGRIMSHIQPPFTEEEKQIGKQVVELNQSIKVEMDQLFAELKTEMKQIKQLKKNNQSYTNPYQNVQTMDGMFMDSKK